MQKLKDDFLRLGIVVNNEYLDKYCYLIEKNIGLSKQPHKTQVHHIVPRYYFKYNNLEVDNTADNLINLLYKDHIMAHYYLALCSSSEKFASFNVAAIYKMSNCPQTNISEAPLELFKSLDRYQELYELHAKNQGKHLIGKKQSAEHIAKRVHKNTGKKRSNETRQKMSAWQKGVPKSPESIAKMKESQKIYFQNESVEHRRARVAKAMETKQKKSIEEKQAISAKISKAMKGRVLSEETKLKHSLALKGVEKTEEHKLQVARAKSIYRYYVDDRIFESTKEVINYLENKFNYNLPYETWRRIINEQTNKYDIKVRRELKERK